MWRQIRAGCPSAGRWCHRSAAEAPAAGRRRPRDGTRRDTHRAGPHACGFAFARAARGNSARSGTHGAPGGSSSPSGTLRLRRLLRRRRLPAAPQVVAARAGGFSAALPPRGRCCFGCAPGAGSAPPRADPPPRSNAAGDAAGRRAGVRSAGCRGARSGRVRTALPERGLQRGQSSRLHPRHPLRSALNLAVVMEEFKMRFSFSGTEMMG